ncbi:hypothetical protein BAY60_32930 [Prauserella muralis]|uniref:Mce-associated membrane protein n=2 Tax=Prauserella muralis TaxID=588067 RepID=A0A2V4AII3_9PSEU|nr:hypothetical protein [Prauserella muralis]PXY19752.1 hypothetical protein BAY60_32930 [Prauserella muralis]
MLAAVAVVALLVAGWFGFSWWSAAHDDRLELARERDTVVADISAALVTLHTIDHRTARSDVDEWLRVTTGKLGEDLSKDRQLQLDRAAGTRTVASASVRELAVTELDRRLGTARLLAVLDVRLGTRDTQPAPSRSRLTVQAQRTGEGWKISAVQAVSS